MNGEVAYENAGDGDDEEDDDDDDVVATSHGCDDNPYTSNSAISKQGGCDVKGGFPKVSHQPV